MKIYFCDGCNESIPLTDIQAGQVTTIKGKLFCRTCIPPGAGGAGGQPAPAAAARSGVGPVLAILLVGLIGYTLWRDLPFFGKAMAGDDEVTGELDDSADDWRVSELERSLGALGDDRDDLDRRLTFQQGDIDSVRALAADLSRNLDQIQEDIDGLVRGQAETGQLIEKLAFQENRTQALESRIDTLADMLAAQAHKLQSGMTQGPSQGTVSIDMPVVDATAQAEIESIRRQLLDPDAGQRFGAVDQIAKGRHKALAPELLPVLRDDDLFVRILAMQVLGDFGYVEAVPDLFAVLEDPNAPIRKAAAETLVRLTGYDPGYDHRASKSEREKAVKRWRDWVGTR